MSPNEMDQMVRIKAGMLHVVKTRSQADHDAWSFVRTYCASCTGGTATPGTTQWRWH